VGERSYGKGSVQGIFPLHSVPSGIRLTTSKFFSPNGQPISDRGILPHRSVQVVAKVAADEAGISLPLNPRDDPMISAALETARQIALASRPTP
jgi:carboxyl-terminal processing protease